MRSFKKIFAVILTSVIVLCGIQVPQKASAETEKKEKRIIVSLGDSFSSGEGIEPFWGQDDILQKLIEYEEKDQKDIQDWLAHRSKSCWSGQLVLDGLKMSEHRDDNWYFAASSGAVINDLYYEQNKNYNLDKRFRKEYGIDKIKQKLLVFHFPKKAEQIIDDIIDGKIHDVALLDDSDYEALKKYGKAKNNLKGNKKLEPQLDIFKTVGKGNTDYVTLTIGGNDAHFTEVVMAATRIGCFAAKGEEHSIANPNALSDSLNASWNHFYENGGIKDSLYKAYEDIQNKAGEQAKIIVAGYPKLLNSSLNPKFKFTIVMPDGSNLFFPALNNVIINNSVSRFNNEIEKIVDDCRENKGLNTFFVSIEGDTYFGGHEAYTDKPFINEIKYLQSEDIDNAAMPPISAYSIHPNEDGAKAYAEAVQNKINELDTNGIISGFIYGDDKKTIDKDILSKVKYISAMDIKSGKRSYGKIVNYETGYYELYVNTVHPNKIEIQLQDGTSFWIQQCEPSEDEDNLAQITVNKREFLRNIDIDFKGQCLLSDSSDFEWYLEPSVEAEEINVVADIPQKANRGFFINSQYSLIKKNGLYGVTDRKGKIVVKPKYESISSDLNNHYVLIEENSSAIFCAKYNVLTAESGNYCEKCGILSTTFYGSSYVYDVKKNALMGVTTPSDYNRNIYLYGQNGCGLFVSDQTVMARSASFDSGYEEYGTAQATLDGKFGSVNGKKIISDFIYENATDFSDGIAAFCYKGKWGYLDSEGRKIIPFEYDSNLIYPSPYSPDADADIQLAYLPSEGYIALNKGDNAGYYNVSGKEIIPVGTFAAARPVHNGLAWVKDKKTGLWGVIRLSRTWQEIYKGKLNEFYNSNEYNVGCFSDSDPGSMFDLCDVDGNGIPELFISQGVFGGATVYVYTADENQLYELQNFGRNGEIFVSQKFAYIKGHYAHMGYITDFICQIDNTSCEQIIKLEHNCIDNIYSIDDIVVSESEYDKSCEEYADEMDWIKCGRQYNFDQIDEIL